MLWADPGIPQGSPGAVSLSLHDAMDALRSCEKIREHAEALIRMKEIHRS
jgi:hypothetical protein